MNLLSIAAALGALNAVFNLGWGASLLGLSTTGPNRATVRDLAVGARRAGHRRHGGHGGDAVKRAPRHRAVIEDGHVGAALGEVTRLIPITDNRAHGRATVKQCGGDRLALLPGGADDSDGR